MVGGKAAFWIVGMVGLIMPSESFMASFSRITLPKRVGIRSLGSVRRLNGIERQYQVPHLKESQWPPLEILTSDIVENLPYRALQFYAKQISVRGNQKAAILRDEIKTYLLTVADDTEENDLEDAEDDMIMDVHDDKSSLSRNLSSIAVSQLIKESGSTISEQSLHKFFRDALRACAKTGNVDEATRCLREMEGVGLKPDEKTYNKVLAACGRSGDTFNAEKFFSEMSSRGITPTTKTYTAMIHAYSHKGEIAGAVSWAAQMEMNGGGDALSYGAIIQRLALEGEISQAKRWLGIAKRRNVSLTAYAYNGFIIDCGRRNDASGARMWMERLLSDRVVPDHYTFVATALPSARVGDYEAVLDLKETLYSSGKCKFEGGVAMDTLAYNCVLLSFKTARKIDLDLVEDVLFEMLSNDVSMDFYTIKHLRSIETTVGKPGYLARLARMKRQA